MTGIDQKLTDEAGRLAALDAYEILDSPREEGFDRITLLVQTVLQVPICAVSLVAANTQWFKSCVGLPVPETSRDVSFCSHAIQGRIPFEIPDALQDPRFSTNPLVVGPPFVRSYLGIPLVTPDGYNLGSLCAIDLKPRIYKPEQVEILRSFAALVVDELELRRIAQTDHLTGATTRRGFTHELEKAMSRFRRSGHPTALLLLDIDHFKHVNDTYGHPTGDGVLRAVARELSRQMRVSDTLGRWGGEEFAMLLQDIGVEDAVDTAERFRASIEKLLVENNPPLQVTASFGVADLSRQVGSVQEWIASADKALYAAKKAGRNRCSIADVSEPEARIN